MSACSRAELRAALLKKNVPAEVADELLVRFSEVGLIDDASFAESWVQSRHKNRHSSRAALRRELKTKGIGEGEINSAMASIGQEEELSAAQAVAQKRLRALRGLPPEVIRRRLMAALTRRGFSYGVVSQVVGDLASESTDGFVWDETEQ